ncbi:YlbG family protein [Phocicoccus pinnipedialis]|uniref:Uncharacterized protein n=1 Tax=Phocicoccus pinnipedialis TaxID=110845 RepID=A0A6V7RGT6_9BACL|nr:YlbG family protein [Jeotgalicoccus pinnipedialis]MBP1939025.1 uncharacterized protein YlbG (UPF0298 family) [Jeotgalicoccus pinnipedialis]CAD2077125.1 hypothetical protein JEOPIN946_01413 [Jeotgalicoccus pinnipedialis]
MLTRRIGLYIYFKQNKFIRQLRRYGNVVYVNTKQKYLLVYINESELDKTLDHLSKLKYVTKVIESEYRNIKTEYKKHDEGTLSPPYQTS